MSVRRPGVEVCGDLDDEVWIATLSLRLRARKIA
jgi:hypothetical protein